MKANWKVQTLSVLEEIKTCSVCGLIMVNKNCKFSSQRSKSLQKKQQQLQHRELDSKLQLVANNL